MEDDRILQSLLDALDESFCAIDGQGIILAVNGAMSKRWNKNHGEVIGLSIYDLLSPETAKRIKDYVDVVLCTGQPCHFENLTEGRYLAYRIYPITDEEGRSKSVAILVLDITEQRRTEAELVNAQNKYLRMFESVTDGIGVIDLNGTIIEANQRLVNIYRLKSKSKLLGEHYSEIVAPGDWETAVLNLKEATHHGSVEGMKYTLFRADGSSFPAEVGVGVLYDSDGDPIGFISIVRDITERTKADQALRESEEKFRSLFMATSEAVCLCDVIYDDFGKAIDDRIIDINPAFEAITGIERRLILGKRASEFYDKPPYLLLHAEVAASGNPASYETYFAPMKKHFQVSVFAPKRGQFSVVFADVTKYKQAEAQLLAKQKKLRLLASELSLAEERERRRIAVEVHDRVSQTLAICKMKLGALREIASDVQVGDSISDICHSIEGLIDETRSLTFELSSPVLYSFGLEAALEHLGQSVEKEHGFRVCFEDDKQVKPLDEDVRVLLFQTTRELLTNIAKHARATKARVCVKRDEDSLSILVEDDGVGFDASTIGSRERIVKGFGLFAIRERLAYINGQVQVDSEQGRGTRISISVPLKHE